MCEFLLVTKGTAGDIVPFLAIGAALRAAGHRVQLLTHSYYADLARSADLEFCALDNAAEFASFVADGPLLETPIGVEAFARKHVLPSLAGEFNVIRNRCHPGRTIIVARYMADIAAQMVAEQLGVPFVRIYTAVAQVATRRLFAQICAARLAADLNRLREQVGLPHVMDWQGWIDSPKWNAGTWPEWFAETRADWPLGFKALGFLTFDFGEMGDLPSGAIELLESDSPPVLITGGTAMWSLAPRFYKTAADACALADIPALLVTRFPELVPSTLPPGVRWFPHLPFGSLIGRVRAIVHHAGTSVLVRALQAGIPSLLMPFGADRPDTAARLKRLGVAECLGPAQWQPDLVCAALQRLLESVNVQTACLEIATKFRHGTTDHQPLEFMACL